MLDRCIIGLVLVLAAGAASAQQIYRWTDEKGRLHVTDTPPPPNAKEVQRAKPAGAAGEAPTPFPLVQALKDFPVTLYTAPVCKEACARAREALNLRGIPFKEVLAWDNDSQVELEKISGGREVPTLLVGRSVQKGFEINTYNSLLDSAGYPRAGILPPRSQAAPKLPDDYIGPDGRRVQAAEPATPEAQNAPSGPYAPGAPSQRSQKK
jgi:glutaredoxin